MRDTLSFQDKIFQLEQNIHKSNQSFDSTQIELLKEIRALVKNIEKEKFLVIQQKEFLEKKEMELKEKSKEIRQTEIWITAKKTDIKKELKQIIKVSIYSPVTIVQNRWYTKDKIPNCS